MCLGGSSRYMFRVASLLLIALTLTLGLEAQKKKRKAAKANAATETKKAETAPETTAEKNTKPPEPRPTEAKAPEAAPEATVKNPRDEMEAYRAIQQRPLSTVQDMVDLILMYRGEFGKFRTPDERLARARELKFIKSQSGEEKLERGTLAYAIMKTYKPESGWLFWITGFQHYAMRDVQQAEIMPAKATEGQNITGEQLLGTITAAEEFVQKRENRGKE